LLIEQRIHQLSLVVFQATMPHTIIQLEQRFEPFVEWFHGLASPAISRFSPLALQVPISKMHRIIFASDRAVKVF